MQLNELFSPEEMEILRTRAERAAAPLLGEDRTGYLSALITTMNGERYALAINELTAVYHHVVITPVPCVPDFVAGIANVRGHIVSVLDLASLLGLGNSPDAFESAIVVANADGSSIGFRVDAVGEVAELAMSQMELIPANANLSRPDYLQGVFPDGTALLNLTAILADPHLIIDESSN